MRSVIYDEKIFDNKKTIVDLTVSNIDSKKYDAIKKKLINFYRKKRYRVKDSKTGSLKIYLSGNSFIWFRQSKTEANILRIISDSPDKAQAESIMKEALNLTKNI